MERSKGISIYNGPDSTGVGLRANEVNDGASPKHLERKDLKARAEAVRKGEIDQRARLDVWVAENVLGELQRSKINAEPISGSLIKEKFADVGIDLSDKDADRIQLNIIKAESFEKKLMMLMSYGAMGMMGGLWVHGMAGILSILGGAGILALGAASISMMLYYKHLQKNIERSIAEVVGREYSKEPDMANSSNLSHKKIALVQTLTSQFYEDDKAERAFIIESLKKHGVKHPEAYADEALEDIKKLQSEMRKKGRNEGIVTGLVGASALVAFATTSWIGWIAGILLYTNGMAAYYLTRQIGYWDYRDLVRVSGEALADESVIIRPNAELALLRQ